MVENSNQQPNKNESLNHQNLSIEHTNVPTVTDPSTIENLREIVLSMDPEPEALGFVDDQANNETNMFHRENDDTGGEHLGSELPLEFSDDDYETNSSTCDFDDMSLNVPVYHMSGLVSEAYGLGVGAENMIEGDRDGISQDEGGVETYVGMRDISEAGDGVRNLEACGEDRSVEGVGERDGWGSIEESPGFNDDVLVFDFRGQGVMDLTPQVVVTVGGHGSVLGGRTIDSWIPELVESVSALYLRERREWEDRNIHDSHVNHGWGQDGVDDGYYIGEYDMVLDDYLLWSGAYGTPAAISVVEDLASRVITQENVEIDHMKCIVCFEEFEVGDMVKVLPCSHYYHEYCILRWLEMHNTCPVCRLQLPIDDPEFEGEENEVVGPHE